MDPIKILKRAWHILWNYRVLWIFGFILAITSAGSSGGSGNGGSQYNLDSGDQMSMPADMQEVFNEAGEAFEELFLEGLPAAGISQEDITALIWIGALFILVMVVIGIGMTFARYTSETAVIRMVDDYEATGTRKSFREGWRIGWSRTSWRLFLIDLIVNIPVFILIAVLAIAGFIIYTMFVGNNENLAVAVTIGLIAILSLTIFVVVLASIVLHLLRHFFWRVSALEDVGVRESLRRGFVMVRENWKSVGIMWLVMMGLGIAWIIVSFIVLAVALPIFLVTVVAGAAIAAIPGMILFGFFSLFLSGYLPWIAAGLFVMPLFFTVAFSPWVLLTAWEKVFLSTVWTLVYREIKALPALAPEMEIEPVGD